MPSVPIKEPELPSHHQHSHHSTCVPIPTSTLPSHHQLYRCIRHHTICLSLSHSLPSPCSLLLSIALSPACILALSLSLSPSPLAHPLSVMDQGGVDQGGVTDHSSARDNPPPPSLTAFLSPTQHTLWWQTYAGFILIQPNVGLERV